jgi:phage/plasmid primase-like uncharacterized protein
MINFIENFLDAMALHNIIHEGEIIADGKLHRFHVKGDRFESHNGWYVLYTTDIPAGSFGCWKRGISETWCIKAKDQMTTPERERHHKRMQEIRLAAETAKKQAHAKAKDIANTIWKLAIPADPNHPYLKKKSIKPRILRLDVNTNNLLVPLFNTDKQLVSLQYITPKSEKRFLKDGAIKGHYCPVGKVNGPIDIIYISEGYATAATVYEATGRLTACAFCSNNLLPVAQAIRSKFPEATIIIAADNDQWHNTLDETQNAGITKANEAAAAINAYVVHPSFDKFNTSNNPTDFNDLMLLAGLEEVKVQLIPADTSHPVINDTPIKTTPKIDEQAFFGIINRFIEISRINSEASSVAVAANFIGNFCAMIGRFSSQWIGDAQIHCRPFFLLIGNSGKSRKGTSEYLVRRVFDVVEELLAKQNIGHQKLKLHGGGLSSGEGIVYAIRDPADNPDDSNDLGIQDKRLLVIESEFANVLAQCKRSNSILSSSIRNLFDGKTLAPLTKTNRISATNPHVVIIGHITKFELNSISSFLEASNGFLNRFLICAIERDHLVPLPKPTSNTYIQELAQEIIDIINFIETTVNQHGGEIEIIFSEEAEACWVSIYPTMTEDRPGYIGALMARTEVYARMLSMIFCLLDKKTTIEVKHLKAALSWMAYIEESIEYIFGDAEAQKKQDENKNISTRILSHLKAKKEMTKTEINNALGGHIDSKIINEALRHLLDMNYVVNRTEPTGGKSREIFTLITAE